MSPLRPRSGPPSSRLCAVLLLLSLGSAEAFLGAEEAGSGFGLFGPATDPHSSSVQEGSEGAKSDQEASEGDRNCQRHEYREMLMTWCLNEAREQMESLQAACEECPAGWSRHLDSCYLIPQTTTSWYAAHHGCAQLDWRARLASVHQASSQFIETLVEASSAAKAVWLGLSQLPGNNGWVWSDASPLDYTNWTPGQPNSRNHRCVHSGWPGYSKIVWFDGTCTAPLNYLCQIDLR